MAVKPSSNNRFGRGSLVSDIAGVSTKKTSTIQQSAADIIKKKHESSEKRQLEHDIPSISENTAETTSTNESVRSSDQKNPTDTSAESSSMPSHAQNSENSVETVSSETGNDSSEESITMTDSMNTSSSVALQSDETMIESDSSQTMNQISEPNTFSNNVNTISSSQNLVNEGQSIQQRIGDSYQPFVPNQLTNPQNSATNPIPGMMNQFVYPNTQPSNQNLNYSQYIQNGYPAYTGNYNQISNDFSYSGFSSPGVNSEFHRTTDYSLFEDYPDINVRLPLKTGGDREMLKKSILESGIADPIIVAPVHDVISAFHEVNFPLPNYPQNVQFIIIAGQNRRSLARELGIELPFIIKRGLTKEQMDTIGLDTNLLNRQFSAMKPSEQVYIVNRRRALFEQNNTRNIRGKLSEITGYEKTYIYQLLSLVHVKKELLTDFVDPGYISVSGITHLVTVPIENQERLHEYLTRMGIKKVMANQMKALLQDSTTPGQMHI